MEYEQIKFLYEAVILTNLEFHLSKYRDGFSEVIKLLKQGHLEGIIESVEGLPTPEEIINFDEKRIQELNLDLLNRYFPIAKEEHNISKLKKQKTL